jgi:hypothetical protein
MIYFSAGGKKKNEKLKKILGCEKRYSKSHVTFVR